MNRLALTFAVLLGTVALANGRPDCLRNCATVQKNFEKQCKETTANDPEGKVGCDLVAKKMDQTCKQSCAAGPKPKKSSNPSSY
jgi:hypothetical protein